MLWNVSEPVEDVVEPTESAVEPKDDAVEPGGEQTESAMVPVGDSPINELLPFEFDGGSLRSFFDANGVICFIAQDACNVLGLDNVSQAVGRLASYMKGIYSVDTLGGKQDMLVVNEFGIFKLAMTSRNPNAQKFQEWLCTEVIPSIQSVLPDFLLNRPGKASGWLRSLTVGDTRSYPAGFGYGGFWGLYPTP